MVTVDKLLVFSPSVIFECIEDKVKCSVVVDGKTYSHSAATSDSASPVVFREVAADMKEKRTRLIEELDELKKKTKSKTKLKPLEDKLAEFNAKYNWILG